VPDILANAGGVVASYDEWRFGITGAKATEEKTFTTVEKILLDAWKEVLDCSSKNEIPLRKAAYTVAATRLVETMEDRGWVRPCGSSFNLSTVSRSMIGEEARKKCKRQTPNY
jgi:glutamate dehydrogenase (NAD(P)+)